MDVAGSRAGSWHNGPLSKSQENPGLQQTEVATPRKRPHISGAICRVRWSGDASGAWPRHVRVRVVSRFSALQKTGKNIEMAANASVFRFRIGVVRPCGYCPAPARFLPGGRFLPGSCPVPAQRPVPARFLPGSCPVPAQGSGCARGCGRTGGRDGSGSGGEYRVYSGALLVLNKQGGFAFLV
jgi:hypothetical protein